MFRQALETGSGSFSNWSEIEPDPFFLFSFREQPRGDVKHTLALISVLALTGCAGVAANQNGLVKLKAGDCAGAAVQFRLGEQADVACSYNNMGVLYERGCPAAGIAPNFSTALERYRVAATKGCARAYSNGGDMYFAGRGVAPSFQNAVDLWTMGANQGDETSRLRLQQFGNPAARTNVTERISQQQAQKERADAILAQGIASMANGYNEGRAEGRANAQQFQQFMRQREAQTPVVPPAQKLQIPSTPPPAQVAVSPTSTISTPVLTPAPTATGCINDVQCGVGMVCVKAAGNTGNGMCVAARDHSGVVPQFPAQQTTVRNLPGCMMDGDCNMGAGYRCIRNRPGQAYGVCLK